MSAVRTSARPPPVADIRPDTVLLGLLAVLVGVGVVVVTSASMELAASRYGDAYHHLYRHTIYLSLGLCVLAAVALVPTAIWRRVAAPGYFLTLGLLLLVLAPGIGREVNGAMRWVALGPVSFQPSEAAKFLLVLYVAHYLSRRQQEVRTSFVAMMRPLGWLLIPATLLLAEPDLGATVVIFGAAAGAILLAGARLRDMSVLLVAGAVALTVLVRAQPYRMERLRAFLNPWDEEVQYEAGYQLTQALIAFGRGEWFGVGLGEGLQKLFYLPEAHTDFIFAVIAEELGALAAIAICIAFAVLVVRGLWHGRAAEVRGDVFAAQLAYGAALMLGVQALVSLGVNTGLLPTKGLTLPLVSYGGNALVVSCALVGLLLRVDWENRLAAIAGARGLRG